MLKKTVNLMPFRPAKIRGAGDVVHALAQPIARAVDAVAGTNLTNCGGCAQRRETLNQIIPMKKILSILSILSVVLTASAQRDWTLSTNNYWADTFVTNVFVGNTSTDPGRDTSLMAWQKINCDFNLIASWHALEAGALAYLDANAVTNTGTGYTLTGTWYGDGTALLINGTNLTAGTVNSNSFDADTITWLSSMGGGSGGVMNFDLGLITSDGSGNISANSINNTNGPIGINNNGDTGGETDPSQILMGQFSGPSPCWIVMQGQGKMSFYSGSGSYMHENYGIHLVCASGQEDNHPNWSDGPMVVGLDYSADLPGTDFPDNSLSVEGYAGFGNCNPGYQVDVTGDINFTGSLYNNGTAIILPDSSGNGGTTLMLRAQDNGTQMYLHVQSDGSSAWTTSP